MKGSFSDMLKEMDKERRSRLAAKVPSWDIPGIEIPTSLNAEQCSSQATAEYKAALCGRLGVRKTADLTGGLGVDCWAFSRVSGSVLYNEMDPALCAAVEYCRSHPGTRLVLEEGDYYLKNTAPLFFNGCSDILFDGNGARFIFSEVTNASDKEQRVSSFFTPMQDGVELALGRPAEDVESDILINTTLQPNETKTLSQSYVLYSSDPVFNVRLDWGDTYGAVYTVE